MPPTAAKMLTVARSHIGYEERSDGWTKFGEHVNDPYGNWCMSFVAYCASQAGGAGVVPQTGATQLAAQWFKDHGLWGTSPGIGDIPFYDWTGRRRFAGISHAGMLELPRTDGVQTIEGNTSDMVAQRVRTAAYIVGYGKPQWAPTTHPPTVRLGDRSDTVRLLQRLANVPVDGIFGQVTLNAVRVVQAKFHIAVDGVCGPLTWTVLGR